MCNEYYPLNQLTLMYTHICQRQSAQSKKNNRTAKYDQPSLQTVTYGVVRICSNKENATQNDETLSDLADRGAHVVVIFCSLFFKVLSPRIQTPMGLWVSLCIEVVQNLLIQSAEILAIGCSLDETSRSQNLSLPQPEATWGKLDVCDSPRFW